MDGVSHIKAEEQPKSLNSVWKNDIYATYEIKRAANAKLELEEIAQKMADGISIGTTQVADGIYTPKTSATHIRTTEFIPGRLRAAITEFVPSTTEKGAARITVAFSSEILTELGGFPMLMAALIGDQYGTAYEIDRGRLVDLKLPAEYVRQFPGPQFGIAGLRELYGTTGSCVPHAAILLKPNTGQPPEHYAFIAATAARGGAHYIKDDEMKVNTSHMIRTVAEAIKRVEDEQGRRILYGPNVTAQLNKAKEHAIMTILSGASAVMINAVHAGLEYVRMFATDPEISVPIHIHRTGHDALTRGQFGLSLKVFTQLWRLAGADQIHIGPVFGGLYRPEEVREIYHAAADPLYHIRPSLAVISRSNVHVIPGTVNYLKTKDLLFLCDDGVYKHPKGIEYGMREVCDCLESVEIGELSPDDLRDINYNNDNVRFE